jgi:hypothetical protein
MRMIAVIEDGQVARKILKHLGLSFRPPPRGHHEGTERQQALFDEQPLSQTEPSPPRAHSLDATGLPRL